MLRFGVEVLPAVVCAIPSVDDFFDGGVVGSDEVESELWTLDIGCPEDVLSALLSELIVAGAEGWMSTWRELIDRSGREGDFQCRFLRGSRDSRS